MLFNIYVFALKASLSKCFDLLTCHVSMSLQFIICFTQGFYSFPQIKFPYNCLNFSMLNNCLSIAKSLKSLHNTNSVL